MNALQTQARRLLAQAAGSASRSDLRATARLIVEREEAWKLCVERDEILDSHRVERTIREAISTDAGAFMLCFNVEARNGGSKIVSYRNAFTTVQLGGQTAADPLNKATDSAFTKAITKLNTPQLRTVDDCCLHFWTHLSSLITPIVKSTFLRSLQTFARLAT